MPAYSLCCLGSLNLVAFVIDPFTPQARFDFKKMAEVVRIAIRALDNVLDATQYPLEKIEKFSKQWRRVGLGFTGLGDALAMLGLVYGSEDSLRFCELFGESLRNESYKASVELAKEKGMAPGLKKNFFSKKPDPRLLQSSFISKLPAGIRYDIGKYGLRNIGLNTAAPTGTISLTVGNNCSSGIEPIFALEYDRNVRTGKGDETRRETVRDYAWLKWKELHPDATEKPEYFVTAAEIDPYAAVDVQATLQKYVDHSISKCIGKDSLVQTSEGLKYMHELVTHKTVDTFQPLKISILNKEGISEQTDSGYYNGIKPVKIITLSNGIQIKATPTHRFWGEQGWIEANALKPGQSLYLRTPTNYVWEKQESVQSKK